MAGILLMGMYWYVFQGGAFLVKSELESQNKFWK